MSSDYSNEHRPYCFETKYVDRGYSFCLIFLDTILSCRILYANFWSARADYIDDEEGR